MVASVVAHASTSENTFGQLLREREHVKLWQLHSGHSRDSRAYASLSIPSGLNLALLVTSVSWAGKTRWKKVEFFCCFIL